VIVFYVPVALAGGGFSQEEKIRVNNSRTMANAYESQSMLLLAFASGVIAAMKSDITHSRVQQLNEITGSDAFLLGQFQQFQDRALHNLALSFCGLPDVIHWSPYKRHVLVNKALHLSEVLRFSPDRLPLSVQNCTPAVTARMPGKFRFPAFA
jgi:hypothetical protein